MYRHLWSNSPKESHEYVDYTFDDHFGKAIPSFVPRRMMRDYLIARVEKSDVRRYIRFNTVVRSVDYDSARQEFAVQTEDMAAAGGGKTSVDRFDYVVVATGHFSTPNMPDFDGVDTFPGHIIHSHDFRDASQFKGQDILVIGGSLSAEDIALQTYKFGAKSVTISYRTKSMGLKWPDGIEERPLLTRIQGSTVHFSDGSQGEFQSIVYCTGYRHHFPFLPHHLRLTTDKNCWYPDPLYKGMFFQDQPRLIYMGMQNLWYSLLLFDAQAFYVRDVIRGVIKLPEESARADDIQLWKNRESSIKDALEALDFQTDYLKDLAIATNHPVAAHLDRMTATFQNWLANKMADVVNFRDVAYTSVVTGTTAVPYHLPWLDVKDDVNI